VILRQLLYVLRHIIVLFFMIAMFKTVTGIYHYCNMSVGPLLSINVCMYVGKAAGQSVYGEHKIKHRISSGTGSQPRKSAGYNTSISA